MVLASDLELGEQFLGDVGEDSRTLGTTRGSSILLRKCSKEVLVGRLKFDTSFRVLYFRHDS